ncbi:MAG: hypothetical protein QM500_21225, partial [Methylococcales bacterium]
IFLQQSFAARKAKIKIYKALLAIGLLLGAYYLQTVTAKVLPVLIQLMLMYFFGRTLLKDKGPPFIESFVRLDFADIPPEILVYARQLTVLWTAFFAFNALMCVALAVFGNDKWWALYNGVFIYLMIGVLTTGEYIYRHFRFPDLAIPDAKSSIKNMFVNGRKIWMDVQQR